VHELIYVAAALAVMVLGGWLAVRGVRRYIRRRWRRWLAAAGGGVVGAVVQSGLGGSALSVLDPRWWAAQRERRRMWGAVSSALRAVEQAEGAGAPVGELPRLCAELRVAASELDRLLAASHTPGMHLGPGALDQGARRDIQGVMVAADQVRQGALSSLRHQASPRVADLVSSVNLETEAFRTGLSRSHGNPYEVRA
jgi:hypothetical protein